MFSSKYNKIVLESLDENIEILEQYDDGDGKLILKVNGKPESVLEYEIYGDHCALCFLETYTEENQGYATKLVERLKEILKKLGIKTIGANATMKSQHILKKVFGEPIEEPKEFGWDEGIGDDLWWVKHNINESYLVEARSEYILKNQKFVNKIANRYLKDLLTQTELQNWNNAEDSDKKNLNLVQNSILNRMENSNYPFISKYIIWVLKQYVEGNWRFPEDISKLEHELELFSKFNHTLEKKDINQYSYEEFSKLALDLEGQYTANEKERMTKDNEAEKIFEDGEWILIHPKTKEADILYGKGTRWCTAATDSYNYFDHYNNQGPLYILINKTDPSEKYQFHWESNSFMNKYDHPINNEEKTKILSDPALKSKLIEIVSSNKTYKEGTDKSYLEYICDTLGIYDEDERLLPDENGMCHITISDSEFGSMYTEERESVSWDFVSKIFTEEGLDFSRFDYNDYYTESDYCNLTKEQIESFYKILNENNLPAISNSDIEYCIMSSYERVHDDYIKEWYEEIFDETNEKSEVSWKYNDCCMYGQEIEATKDIEKQILEYFGYNADFDWVTREKRRYNAEKNQYESYNVSERVIKFDVPAKDLHIPSMKPEDIDIFPYKSDDYDVSFIEYLINTLYNYDKCSVGEPYYGWDGFDEETWKDFITDEYIPAFKEVIESKPERLERIRKEYKESLEKEDFEESVLNKTARMISERNNTSKPNTFKQVFNKINEQELDEGKFGKALGALATAATIGLGGLHVDNVQAAQYNPNNQEQVLNYKFAAQRDIPEWIEHAGKLSTDNGKLYFTAEIIRNENADNTAHLERIAQSDASCQLVDILKRAVNSKISGQLNSIEGNITVSKLKPSKSFWLLMKPKGEAKEYHAYSRVEIDQNDITNALTNALKKANPQANTQQLQKIVQDSIQSIMS